MAEIPLIAQLLIAKRQRDSQRRREDSLLAREDFRWDQEQARRAEAENYRRGRDAIADQRYAEERDRRVTRESLQDRISGANMIASGNAEVIGGEDPVAGMSYQNAVDPSRYGGTLDIGGMSLGILSPEVKQQRALNADEAEYQRNVRRTQDMLQTLAPMAPAGARVSTVNPGSGSVTFASTPQPRVPPRPTRGDITDNRAIAAFQAIQDARSVPSRAGIMGNDTLSDKSDGDLQALASTYAQQAGDPSLTLTILKMLRDQQRNERYAAKTQQGTEPRVVDRTAVGGGNPRLVVD